MIEFILLRRWATRRFTSGRTESDDHLSQSAIDESNRDRLQWGEPKQKQKDLWIFNQISFNNGGITVSIRSTKIHSE